MNYQKIYNDIINKAKKENRIKLRKTNPLYVYYENHHILPICLKGTNDPKNLVLLTAREHFICHKLLTYIYPGNRKIALAYHKMAYGNHKNFHISSRDYAYARELISKTPISEETKHKQSESHIGFNHTNETKNKIALSKIGKHRDEKTKLKCKEAQIGKKKNFKKESLDRQKEVFKKYNIECKKNKSYEEQMIELYGEETGLIKAKEYKEKLSKSKKNKPRHKKLCPYCNREIAEGNYGKYHGEKCNKKIL